MDCGFPIPPTVFQYSEGVYEDEVDGVGGGGWGWGRGRGGSWPVRVQGR